MASTGTGCVRLDRIGEGSRQILPERRSLNRVSPNPGPFAVSARSLQTKGA